MPPRLTSTRHQLWVMFMPLNTRPCDGAPTQILHSTTQSHCLCKTPQSTLSTPQALLILVPMAWRETPVPCLILWRIPLWSRRSPCRCLAMAHQPRTLPPTALITSDISASLCTISQHQVKALPSMLNSTRLHHTTRTQLLNSKDTLHKSVTQTTCP